MRVLTQHVIAATFNRVVNEQVKKVDLRHKMDQII